jgi:2-(1,2-epoxy-1,2-dihydrophenyl)acetyl-CoA isomerase
VAKSPEQTIIQEICMTTFETARYKISDSVATVTMNRPESLNAWNALMRKELAAALSLAAEDQDVRVVLLRGEGRSFGVGADLKEVPAVDTTTMLMEEYWPVVRQIVEMPKPVISAVQGPAAGIHVSMVLASDLAVMADDARLVLPFTNIALIPDGGACWLLLRELGYKRAYQVAAESDSIPADRAVEFGLVNRVVPAEQLDAEAAGWAVELAARAPMALAGIKQMMRQAGEAGFAEIYRREADLQLACTDSEDAREGVDAFLSKRKPHFTGN